MNFKSTLLAAAASLIVAAPVLAQDAMTPPAPAAEAAQAAPSAEEAAFQAEAEAFEQRVEPMGAEIEAAVMAAGDDTAKAQADADAVVDRYASEFNAFADKLDAFLDSQIAAATDDAQRTGLTQARAQAGTQLRGAPAMIKAQVAQQLAAAQAAPAAPATPPTE